MFRMLRTPPVEVQFFRNNFFCGNFVLQKSWNSHQPRLGVAPLPVSSVPWSDRALRRKFTSGASATGPVVS